MELWQVDAFTDRPFGGNAAAVCLVDRPRDERWMRSLAAELKLSETAFATPVRNGYELRWFTPVTEVALCGHATLATAHVLWTSGAADTTDELRFDTRGGQLTARRDTDLVWLDFPALPAAPAPPADRDRLAAAVRATPRWVGRSRYDYLVELGTEAEVRAVRPDLDRIRALGGPAVIVTAPGEGGAHDFVSRYFDPTEGLDEDPVTGSAHCALGPHWAARFGRTDLLGYQASARGGQVRVRLAGDRAHLGGRAVTVLRATLDPRL